MLKNEHLKKENIKIKAESDTAKALVDGLRKYLSDEFFAVNNQLETAEGEFQHKYDSLSSLLSKVHEDTKCLESTLSQVTREVRQGAERITNEVLSFKANTLGNGKTVIKQ